MENKILFQVDTAWTFPVLQYTANTSYVEVRKASGIAYILLQLISRSDNNEENLVATLKNLGVPCDIHYIFASELANMISYGIIRMKSEREFGSDLIDLYVISDFEITELGKKLFAEGTIPTGNDKIKKIQLYYDVSKKDILIKCDWKMFRLENSSLDENCIGNVVLNDSDVEMFINENMNRFAFRKGERISGFEHEKPEKFVYKMDDAVTISINSENMCIHAKDKSRDVFIHSFYSADIITRIMDAKKKYHFPEFLMSEVVNCEYDSLNNIVKLNMPSQITNVTNVKTPLALNGYCEIKGSQCSVDKNTTTELMQKYDIKGVAAYFENGNLYTIIPGRFLIAIEGYSEKCSLNLIAVQKIDESIKQQLVKELLLKCIENSEPFECSDIIKQLTKISECKDYLEQFASCLLQKKNTCTEKIEEFLKISDEFSQMNEWSEYARNSAKKLLDDLCSEVSLGGFTAQNSLGKKLNKILGLNDIDYLSKIGEKLIAEEGDEVAFETMESIGYRTDIVLSVVNVFEKYCNKIIANERISGNSRLSGQCALLGQSLSELRDITGIYNPTEDSVKLDFDNERFIQVMATFTDSLKKMERYKAYAMNSYKMLNAFYERFIEIKEVVTIEKEAFKNPKNINKSYIDQRLKKSRYKDAICDLHVRLQYELNRLFNMENMPTFELLTNAGISRYLTEDEVDDMHALRKCRNGFQHPKEKREVQYSENRIREWCTIVEKLGGMDNESRSKN